MRPASRLGLGWMSAKDWQETATLSQQYLGIKKIGSISQAYTNQFVPNTPRIELGSCAKAAPYCGAAFFFWSAVFVPAAKRGLFSETRRLWHSVTCVNGVFDARI